MGSRVFASCALIGVLFGFGIYAVSSSAAGALQSARPTGRPVVTPVYETRPAVASKVAGASSATYTPTLNSRFAREVTWQFGGKQQRGWYIYTPLIQQLVRCEASPDSPEFATAVAEWKRSCGLPADGTIDERSWTEMMTRLQRARTYNCTPCPDDELVQTSADLWLFPERPAELRMVRRDAFDAYTRMVADARRELGADAGSDYFKLVSGFRSAAYQAQLRAQAGNPSSTAGLAKNSPHFSGRAIDVFVGGDPVSTKDENRALQVATPAYKWLAKNASRYGFRPYFYEPWHWEFDPALAAQASAR